MDDFMSIERIPDERDFAETIGMPATPIATPPPSIENLDTVIPPMPNEMGVSFTPPVSIAPPAMQAPMPATLPIMPSPVNITGRDELIQGGFMPQPVLPQLELPTTPVSIPAITSPVMPQMPVDLGMIPAPSVNLPLPQTE